MSACYGKALLVVLVLAVVGVLLIRWSFRSRQRRGLGWGETVALDDLVLSSERLKLVGQRRGTAGQAGVRPASRGRSRAARITGTGRGSGARMSWLAPSEGSGWLATALTGGPALV